MDVKKSIVIGFYAAEKSSFWRATRLLRLLYYRHSEHHLKVRIVILLQLQGNIVFSVLGML